MTDFLRTSIMFISGGLVTTLGFMFAFDFIFRFVPVENEVSAFGYIIGTTAFLVSGITTILTAWKLENRIIS